VIRFERLKVVLLHPILFPVRINRSVGDLGGVVQ
jgi:hypothetical protein